MSFNFSDVPYDTCTMEHPPFFCMMMEPPECFFWKTARVLHDQKRAGTVSDVI